MNENLLKKLDDITNDPGGLSLEQMEQFVHEMLGVFDTLRFTLSNGNEEEKKKAIQTAYDIQDKLQLLAKKASEKVGLSGEDIKKFLSTGAFPQQELKIFQNAQQEMKDYQKHLERL